MAQAYNMGAIEEECEMIQELKRSGREGMALPTTTCNPQEVLETNNRYIFNLSYNMYLIFNSLTIMA